MTTQEIASALVESYGAGFGLSMVPLLLIIGVGFALRFLRGRG
jgi:hypothetical protein